MSRYRTIAGPTSVRVERNGVTSEIVSIGESHGVVEVREIAETLHRQIVRKIAFLGWLRHRHHMSRARSLVAHIKSDMGLEWHPGPRIDLASTVPWRKASAHQWLLIDRTVAGMLLHS